MRRLAPLIGCLIAFAAVPAAAYGQTASAAQYGGVEQEVVTGGPTAPPPQQGVEEETATGGPTTPGAQRGPSEDAVAGPESAEGTLPFTGRDLVLILVAGLGLVGLGAALRRTARAPARI